MSDMLKSESAGVVHPEAIEILLALLGLCDEPDVQLKLLGELDKLFGNSKNLDTLSDGRWIEWTQEVFAMVGTAMDRRVSARLHALLRRVLFHTLLQRTPKAIERIKDMVDAEEYQIAVRSIVWWAFAAVAIPDHWLTIG